MNGSEGNENFLYSGCQYVHFLCFTYKTTKGCPFLSSRVTQCLADLPSSTETQSAMIFFTKKNTCHDQSESPHIGNAPFHVKYSRIISCVSTTICH